MDSIDYTHSVKAITRTNKSFLSLLPYYHCKILKNAHPNYNSLIDSTSRKSLDDLCSLHDRNLFSLNPRNDLNINPEENCLNNFPRSKYFFPLSFKNEISTQNSAFHISIIHNNIRSLKKNLKEFQIQVLNEIHLEFTLIGLTEIRICNSDNLDCILLLPGYYLEFAPTPLSAAGVGFYINNKLNYKVINKTSNKNFQALWIEILNSEKKNIVCGIVYRQHDNPETFLEYLSEILEDVCRNNKKSLSLG